MWNNLEVDVWQYGIFQPYGTSIDNIKLSDISHIIESERLSQILGPGRAKIWLEWD